MQPVAQWVQTAASSFDPSGFWFQFFGTSEFSGYEVAMMMMEMTMIVRVLVMNDDDSDDVDGGED